MVILVRAAFLLMALAVAIFPALAVEPANQPLMLLATPQLADPVFGQSGEVIPVNSTPA